MPTHYNKDGDSTIENTAEAVGTEEAMEPGRPQRDDEAAETEVNMADELAAQSASVAASSAHSPQDAEQGEEGNAAEEKEVTAEELESFDQALKTRAKEDEIALEREQAMKDASGKRRKPETDGDNARTGGEFSRAEAFREERERGTEPDAESIEQMLSEAADDSRPLRHIDQTVDDPLADSDSDEDVTSGNYRRKTGNRGIYTGGNRKERLMSGDRIETSSEKESRGDGKRKGGGIKALLIVLILIAIAAICTVAYMVVRDKRQGGNSTTAAAESTASAGETTAAAAETTVAGSAAESGAAASDVTWTQNSNEQITTLVNNYYTALAAGDTKTLQNLVDPSVTVDANSVASQANAVEAYQNISTYVANGQNAGEYAVYVSYEMKFSNIATAAPGLVPAYVKTQSDGSLRIIPYANFDSTVSAYMDSVSQSATIQQLASQINASYQSALAGDANLKKYIDSLGSTDAGSTTAAAETTAAATGTTAAQQTTAAAQETTAAETTAKAKKVKFKAVDDIQYTTTQVKLRKEPVLDDNTNDFLLIDGGVWVHVVGLSKKWAKVVTQSGNTGYIYRQYLTVDDPNASE